MEILGLIATLIATVYAVVAYHRPPSPRPPGRSDGTQPPSPSRHGPDTRTHRAERTEREKAELDRVMKGLHKRPFYGPWISSGTLMAIIIVAAVWRDLGPRWVFGMTLFPVMVWLVHNSAGPRK